MAKSEHSATEESFKVELCRPKGGYKTHLKPKGTWSALCGYGPSAPKAFLMKDRSGWVRVPAGGVGAFRICEKCEKKARKLGIEIPGENNE
jgi:hypothetical protein